MRRAFAARMERCLRGLGLALVSCVALTVWAEDAPSLRGEPALHHPIVLVHGATIHGDRLYIGPFDYGDYFFGIAEFFAETGTKVKVVELMTDATIEEQAVVLKNFLSTDPELRGHEVNIVAHSLGGLDTRWCITILKDKQIISLTTIGTPHLGTPLADWAVQQMDGRGIWYWLFRLAGYDMAKRRFLRELTTSSMKRFNAFVPNSPSVKYFSARTRARFDQGTLSYLLWFPMHWLDSMGNPLSAEGADGLVPYASQAWGREIAHSSSLDHLGQMNHHELRAGQQAETLRVYREIYRNLALEGL